MNNEFVTIAPATDAFTNVYCPACNAAIAMTSSVRLPSVALSRQPTESAVFAATDSVAQLSRTAKGEIANTERTICSVFASWLRFSAASAMGTNTNHQR